MNFVDELVKSIALNRVEQDMEKLEYLLEALALKLLGKTTEKMNEEELVAFLFIVSLDVLKEIGRQGMSMQDYDYAVQQLFGNTEPPQKPAPTPASNVIPFAQEDEEEEEYLVSFAEALDALKDGMKVARIHWDNYWFMDDVEIGDNNGHISEDEEVESYLVFDLILNRLEDGSLAVATLQQEDVLAEDWVILV